MEPDNHSDAESSSSDEEVSQHPPVPPPSNTLVIYPNPEKAGRVRLGREEFMPNATSRILLSGPPGSGKRNLILNIIRRMVPPPSMCYLVHCDPDTIEYDILADWGIPLQMFKADDIPTLKNIEQPDSDDEGGAAGGGVAALRAAADGPGEDEPANPADEVREPKPLANPLVVIDEITAQALGPRGLHRLERLVNHVCTHRNTTLLCSIQSAANIPPAARRGFNHFVLWKQADKVLDKIMSSRAGIEPEVLEGLFGLLRDPKEFVWIDLDSSRDSPWRYRVGFEPVERLPPEPELAARSIGAPGDAVVVPPAVEAST